MNPTRLMLANVGRFPCLDWEIPLGITAITGANGAGKSTILDSIELGLFANGSADLAEKHGLAGERMEIELTFAHAGDTYRTRQGYRESSSGRGSATVDLERLDGVTWVPLTREDAASTRKLIAGTIGLSRRTLAASAFLKQGNLGDFAGLTPGERKACLGEILDYDQVWPTLAARARADAKTAGDETAVLRARIADRETVAAWLADLEDAYGTVVCAAGEAQLAVAAAEEKFEQAQAAAAANVAAAERVKAAAAARDRAAADLGRARAEALAATDAASRLPTATATLQATKERAKDVDALDQQVDTERRQLAEQAAAQREHDVAVQQAEALEREAARLHAEHLRLFARTRALSQKRQELQDDDAHAKKCDACGQTLGAEAREHRLRTLGEDLRTAATDMDGLAMQHTAAARSGEVARAAVPASPTGEPPLLAATEARRDAARDAAALIPEQAHAVDALADQAMRVDELTAALRAAAAVAADAEQALGQATYGVADEAELARAVNDARIARDTRRRASDAAAAESVRLEQQVAQTRTVAAELAPLRRQVEELDQRIDLLKVAERAYGRDGIPALIAENVAVPYIEQETNRILEQWPTSDGSVLRVEIHTQAALKTADHLKETLLILVSHDGRTGDYLSFSGGERARLSIALRVALAKLLASRRGAESRLLVIDEPDALDAGGMEALATILAGLASTFSRILIVSHNPLLASAFEQTVEVVKTGGVSTVAGVELERALVAASAERTPTQEAA